MLRNHRFPPFYHRLSLFRNVLLFVGYLFGNSSVITTKAFPTTAASNSMQSVPSTSITIPSSTSNNNNNLTLVGRSRAGDGTTFIIPQLKWMFDCGAFVDGGGLKQPSIIWLTHTHSDHILTLAHFTHRRELSQDLKKKKKSTKMKVYLPAKALPFVKSYLTAYNEMITMERTTPTKDGDEPQDSSSDDLLSYELIPVIPNQEIYVKQSGKEFLIKIIKCDHRIDCVGYSIFEKQSKLKNEYKQLPGREIGALRKQGIDITVDSFHPLLCYLGDTTHKVFNNHREILREHTMIVVECSFLDEQTIENAIKHKHMHWNNLSKIINSHPTILFVLIHFSLRHSAREIKEFFQQYNNIHPMLIESEIESAELKNQNPSGRVEKG